MKLEEARDLIAMMHAATGGRMTGERQGFWEAQLQHLDGDIATHAMLAGIKVWKHFPSWADFGEVYTAESRRRSERQESLVRRQHEQTFLPATALPFWVKRWAAARMLFAAFGRERDERPFREQLAGVEVPGLRLMPDDEWMHEAEQITDAQAFSALRASGSNDIRKPW